MTEQWRDIPGYVGAYQASDAGRVRSVDRIAGKRRVQGLILQQTTDKDGYQHVALWRDSKQRHCHVGRLVLTAFDREPSIGDEACHKNHRPGDNSVGNLEWGTRLENERQKTAAGRRTIHSKLSQADVRRVRWYLSEGWPQMRLGALFGVSQSMISLIATKKAWV